MTPPSPADTPAYPARSNAGMQATLNFKRHRADPSFFKVMLGESRLGKIHESEISAMGLTNRSTYKGQEIDEVRLMIVRHQVRHKAAALLARRPWSAKNISERLQSKGFDEQAVKLELEYMHEQGWLDDAKAAEQMIESLSDRDPMSRDLAANHLAEKGIEEPEAKVALDTYYAQIDLPGMLKTMALDRKAALLESQPDMPAEKQAQRIAERMGRRGFDEETIRIALTDAGYTL